MTKTKTETKPIKHHLNRPALLPPERVASYGSKRPRIPCKILHATSETAIDKTLEHATERTTSNRARSRLFLLQYSISRPQECVVRKNTARTIGSRIGNSQTKMSPDGCRRSVWRCCTEKGLAKGRDECDEIWGGFECKSQAPRWRFQRHLDQKEDYMYVSNPILQIRYACLKYRAYSI